MAFISLDEAREYLRVDSAYEDSLILGLIEAAEAACRDTARLSPDEWDAVVSQTEDEVSIRGETFTRDEVTAWKATLRVAELFTLSYMYEHREDADYHAMFLTLRSLLFYIREGVL